MSEKSMAMIGVGLLVMFLFGGSPAELVRGIRQDGDPVGLVLGVVVVGFIVGSFVMMAVGH